MRHDTCEGAPVLRYGVLGPLRVHRGDHEIQLGARKERAVLAMLLANANQVVSTDRLLDELWADSTSTNPENVLWVNISKLRSALDPDRAKGTDSVVLVTSSPGYMLVTEPGSIDAGQFESLTDEGRRLLDVDPTAASLVFHEALALWKGRAFEEFVYDEFAQTEIARLEEMRLTAVEDRIDADLRAGSSRELVGELESLTRLNPLRESLAAHLMVALHRSGRQGEALRAFGTYRRTLRDELGLDPSADLSALEERIVLDDPTLRLRERVLAPAGVPPTVAAGSGIRGHELRERIGVGPLGVVHVAYEPSAGRELALKVIRPELADDPDFIRRFETDTQLAKALDHPRIVETIDRWRQPGAAYMTMPLFERGSLQAALDRNELSLEDAVRVIDNVAEALGAAHRLGVVHGDLKPSNILLGADGNASVADFARGASVTPTPFTAPEQQTGRDATARSDGYSLAMIAKQMMQVVDPDSLSQAPVASVLARGADANPLSRYEGPAQFAHDLREALGHGSGTPLVSNVENPYVGLEAFQERDAGRFFGRERLIERLVARLGQAGVQRRLIVLVGPSGAGKSSVVRAGVLPAIRGDAIGNADQWFHATMTPGSDPFAALALALHSVAVDEVPGLAEHLRVEGIAAPTARLLPEPDARLLLVVDQLEELFTHSSTEDADAFLDALAASADDTHSPVKVIATLRADHYDRPLRHQAFGELLRHGTELITPMTAAELEQATVAPATAVGVTFEAGLVPEIVSDVVGQASALPLLQHAMAELFERRAGASIDAAAYRGIGGVTGALVHTAEHVYDEFDSEAHSQIRDVFLRLVTLGDGTSDMRRRVLASELTGAGASQVPDVLEAFGRHRLLSFDHDPVTRGATVEIAHESLLTEWRRLAEWIDDSRVDVQAQQSLSGLASTWHEHNEAPGFLLSEGQTDRYAGWIDRPPVRLTTAESAFLTSSVAAVDANREADVRRLRRLRRLVTITGGALVVALIAGGVALSQRNSAQSSEDEARVAQAEALDAAEAADEAAAEAAEAALQSDAAAAEAVRQTEVATAAVEDADLATLISRSAAQTAENPEVSLLLALEAHRRSPVPETEQAVLNALGSSQIPNRVATFPKLDLGDCSTPAYVDRRGFAEFGVAGGRLMSLDLTTGRITDHGPSPVECGAWLGDLTTGRIAMGSPAGDRNWIGSLDDPDAIELEQSGPMFLFNSDLSSGVAAFVVESPQLAVQLFDATTGRAIGEPIEANGLWSAEIDGTGSFAAVGVQNSDATSGNGRIRIVDATTGEQLFQIDTAAIPASLTFDLSNQELVAGMVDGSVLTVDLVTGDVVSSVATTATAPAGEVSVRSDGRIVAVSSGQIELLDRRADTSSVVAEIRDAFGARVRPDGTVVAFGVDGTFEIIDLEGSALVERSWPIDPSVRVAFNAGKAGIRNGNQVVETVDLATGERTEMELRTPNGELFVPDGVYPEPDGVWAVTEIGIIARWEGDAMVERLDFPGRLGTWTRFEDTIAVLGIDADGNLVASLVNLVHDEAGVLFTVPAPDGYGVHPALDGGLHVFDQDGTLRTYDASGEQIGQLATGAQNAFINTMDPSSGALAVAADPGGVVVIDATTGAVENLPGNDSVANLGFARDGQLLVITGLDGTVRVWDLVRGEAAGLVWNGPGATFSSPSWYDESSGSIWVYASGQLLEIPLSPERWVERACDIVGRNLTADEWQRFVPGDRNVQSACT